MKTLLLGLGNPILGDDAVGIRLAREIGARLAGVPDLAVRPDCPVGGLGLLEFMAGFERIIVIDSIRSAGGMVGEWRRFTATSLRETMHLSGVHDANFATALELGRRLGEALPPDEEIHLFAVEIRENDVFGETLSPLLERAYEGVRDGILDEVRALLEAPGILTSPAPRSDRGESRS